MGRLEPDPSATGSSAGVDVDTDYASASDAIGDEPDDLDDEDSVESPNLAPHPLSGLSDAKLTALLRDNPRVLGAATLGRPNAGSLFNAVQLPDHPAWKRVDPSHAWATPETIEFLTKGLFAVAERFPGTPAVSIGHLSAKQGGHLRPHVSHQSGRDVDVGFYYNDQSSRWYKRVTADNLDLERTWWFVRTLVRETPIEMILVDQSLIEPLERYALTVEENREWVDAVFHRRNGRAPIVRHAPGHATHLHLRFWNPIAQETGRRVMPLLVARGLITTPPKLVTHVARSGDTLAKLAAKYSTTMQAIRHANAMKTYQLVAGRTYRIPVQPNTSASKNQTSAKRAASGASASAGQ